MSTKTTLGVFAASLLTGLIVLTSTFPVQSHEPRGLIGSWDVTITTLDWPLEPLPAWYRARATFSRGGGLVQTVTDPFLTSGHGSWVRTGPREYAVTTFLSWFDGHGSFLGTIKASASIRVSSDGDEFLSDPYRFDYFDSAGTLVLSGVGTARGTRIAVQPIDSQ